MKANLKNILIIAAGVIVLFVLFRLAWVIAGVVLRVVLWAAGFAVMAGLVAYLVAQFRRRR